MNKDTLKKLLLGGFIGSVTLCNVVTFSNSYKLEKYQKRYENIVIKKTPVVEGKKVELNIDYLESLPICEEVLDFIAVVFKNRDSIEHANLYRNLSSIEVKVKRKDLLDVLFGVREVGTYFPVYNVIYLNNNSNKTSFFIESRQN